MKKTIAIILTILMAASTFTACSQANGVAESSVDGSPETAVSTVDETVESTQKATSASKTVTAETSPVSDKSEPSTTEPSKPKKTATSQNSGNVAQNYGNDGERSASSQISQNEAPVQQQKAESKAEEKPQTPQIYNRLVCRRLPRSFHYVFM